MQSQSFSAMAAYEEKSVSLRLPNGEPLHSAGLVTAANLFDVLRVNPMLGRAFLPDEGQPGKPCTVILSATFWRQPPGFAGDPYLTLRAE